MKKIAQKNKCSEKERERGLRGEVYMIGLTLPSDWSKPRKSIVERISLNRRSGKIARRQTFHTSIR